VKGSEINEWLSRDAVAEFKHSSPDLIIVCLDLGVTLTSSRRAVEVLPQRRHCSPGVNRARASNALNEQKQ